MSRFILKAANSFLNLIVVMSLFLAASYAGYALWDNNQVYAAAENVQDSMIKLKPVVTEEEGASFKESAGGEPGCVCLGDTGQYKHQISPSYRGKRILLISTRMYMGILLSPEAFSWIPEMTMISMIWFRFCMDTIWKKAICSATWINLRIRHFLMRTRPAS